MWQVTWLVAVAGGVGVAVAASAAPGIPPDEHFERLMSEEKYAEAETAAQDIVEESLRVHGPYHRDTVWALGDLALACEAQQKHAAAEQAYRRALAAAEKVLGQENPHIVEFILGLAEACRLQDRADEAALYYRRAIAIQEQATASIQMRLAGLDLERGNAGDAAKLLGRALEVFEATLGTADPTTEWCRTLLRNAQLQPRLRSRYSEIDSRDVLRPRRAPEPTTSSKTAGPVVEHFAEEPALQPEPSSEPDDAAPTGVEVTEPVAEDRPEPVETGNER